MALVSKASQATSYLISFSAKFRMFTQVVEYFLKTTKICYSLFYSEIVGGIVIYFIKIIICFLRKLVNERCPSH